MRAHLKSVAHGRIHLMLRIALVIIFGLLVFSKVRPGRVVTALAGVSAMDIVTLCLGSLVLFGIRVLKWAILLRASGIPAGFSHMIFSFARGVASGSVTPMQIGEITRATSVPKGYRGRCIGLMVIDKALDLLALVALAVVSIGYSRDRLIPGLVAAGVILAIALRYRLAIISFTFAAFSKLSRALGSTRADFRLPIWQWNMRITLGAMVLSLIGYAIIGAQYGLLFQIINPGYDRAALLVCPLMILARAVPLTFSGLGIREGIAVSLLPRFGLSPEESVGASLVMYVLNLWLPLVIALVSIIMGVRGSNGENSEMKE